MDWSLVVGTDGWRLTIWLARPVAVAAENVVEVSTLGADGTVLTTAY